MKWYRYYYQLINTHTVPRTSAHYPHQPHTETTWIKPTHFHKQLSVISASRGARYCQAHDLRVCNEYDRCSQESVCMSIIGFYRSMIEIFLLSWFLFFFWDCRLTIIGYDIAYCDFGNSNTVWYISPPWAAGWWWWWWCGYKYSFGMRLYTGQQCSVPARLQTLSHFNYCQLLITTHPYIIKLYSNTCATTTTTLLCSLILSTAEL